DGGAAFCRSALLCHVAGVVSHGPAKKVRRVHAPGIVAPVTNTLRLLARRKKIRYAVGEDHPATKSKLPVAVPVLIGSPLVTVVQASDVDLRPVPLDVLLRQFHLCSPFLNCRQPTLPRTFR